MARYAAFLRGVMPTNAKMPELRRAFEAAGFEDVSTVLSSGNVLFTCRAAAVTALERRSEAAMMETLGRSFLTFVRPVDELRALLQSDPYRPFRLKADVKRVVTFMREPPARKIRFPVELRGARVLGVNGLQAYSAYVRDPKSGPDFMTLIENTFGKDVTTRTWDTIAKVAR